MDLLNTQQKRLFKNRLEVLKEEGFFQPEARDMAGDDTTGTRYLIVSYGGTGVKALYKVKEQFEKIIPEAQLKDRVRFLAIDTDKKTQIDTVRVEDAEGNLVNEEIKLLDDNQFLQLRGSYARNMFNGTDLPETVQEWIAPELVETLRADVTRGEAGTYLKDTGASGIRQIGRVSLYPSETYSAVRSRIANLVSEITVGTAAPLRVIILTGIAGGTGSGTVIDLTYLIRDTISNLSGAVGNNTEYFGFVMLPSAGSSKNQDDISHGNRNGYAALKEINHYMTLQQRNKSVTDHDKREKYTFTYGNGYTVSSDSDLFSVCFLMDGVSGGVVHENPMEQVGKVIAEGLLDIVTANQIVDANGKGIQCLDSFMNDAKTFRDEMLSKVNPKLDAPRDADYVYCALGHNEFSIPTHMLKTYIAKHLLDKIYKTFQNCANVEDGDAKQFVRQIARKEGNSTEEVRGHMMAALKPVLNDLDSDKAGPWYAINLLYDVCEKEIPRLDRALIPGINKDMRSYIKEAATQLNDKFFKAFVASLEALKALLGEQYKTVISSTPVGNKYHFIPESLGDLSGADAVVKRLGFFARESEFRAVYKALIDEALTNSKEWAGFISTNVTTSREAISGMRRFWNTQLNGLLRNHLQDLLVKYFARDPNASYDPADPQTTVYLDTAANAIFNSMLGAAGKAQPMLDFTGKGINIENMKPHTYLMVPQEAPELMQALERVARTKELASGDVYTVCSSHSTDTIACYRQFNSIPAFKLNWTQKAESSYENGILTETGTGMHMSQTVGGKRWSNLPNLLPKSTWQLTPVVHKNPREEAIAQQAADLFNKALTIPGMVSYIMAGSVKHYSVAILPQAYRPADALFKKLDSLQDQDKVAVRQEIEQAAAQIALELSQKNFTGTDTLVKDLSAQAVVCEYQSLNVAPVLSFSDQPSEAPADWYEYVAGTMLRKLPETMHALDGSLLVMEKLAELVKIKLHEKTQYARFVKYLAADLFIEDTKDNAWKFENKMGVKKVLCRTGNTLVDAAPYYFMYQAYREKEADVEEALSKIYEKEYALPEDEDNADYTPKAKALMASGKALYQKLEAWISADPHVFDDSDMEKLAQKREVSLRDIRAFYDKLKETAGLFGSGEFNV